LGNCNLSVCAGQSLPGDRRVLKFDHCHLFFVCYLTFVICYLLFHKCGVPVFVFQPALVAKPSGSLQFLAVQFFSNLSNKFIGTILKVFLPKNKNGRAIRLYASSAYRRIAGYRFYPSRKDTLRKQLYVDTKHALPIRNTWNKYRHQKQFPAFQLI
jgi:hypothetical protein